MQKGLLLILVNFNTLETKVSVKQNFQHLPVRFLQIRLAFCMNGGFVFHRIWVKLQLPIIENIIIPF